MKETKLMILALVAVILMGCNDKNTAPSSIRLEEAAKGSNESYRMTDEELSQVDASNALGLDVLRYFMSKDPKKSMVVSPSGIRYNLSMLANGADGPTLSILQKAIGDGNDNLDDVNELNRRMMIGQRKAPILFNEEIPSTMTTINTFEDMGIGINDRYKDLLEDSYFATVEKKLSEKHKARLRSDIKFEAPWETPFYDSKEGFFHTADGDSVKVMMMANHDEERKLYGMSNRFCSAVSLPYIGNFYMLVILPTKGTTTSTLLKKLSVNRLKLITRRLHYYSEVNLHLPAFRTKVNTSLKESLTSLGYGNMFTAGKANFSRINDGTTPLYVDEISQSTEIVVDENGSFVKSTTESGIVELSAYNSGKQHTVLDFYANRPFFYAIYDIFGNICFCGVFTGK